MQTASVSRVDNPDPNSSHAISSFRPWKLFPKRPWTEEENAQLQKLVEEYGPKGWKKIARSIRNRNAKQCRQRWMNHLDPKINREPWSIREQQVLFLAHDLYKSKWSKIAQFLPGRTDNCVKNHWNSIMRKKLQDLARRFEVQLKESSQYKRNRLQDISNKLNEVPQNTQKVSSMLVIVTEVTETRNLLDGLLEQSLTQKLIKKISYEYTEQELDKQKLNYEFEGFPIPTFTPKLSNRQVPYCFNEIDSKCNVKIQIRSSSNSVNQEQNCSNLDDKCDCTANGDFVTKNEQGQQDKENNLGVSSLQADKELKQACLRKQLSQVEECIFSMTRKSSFKLFSRLQG